MISKVDVRNEGNLVTRAFLFSRGVGGGGGAAPSRREKPGNEVAMKGAAG